MPSCRAARGRDAGCRYAALWLAAVAVAALGLPPTVRGQSQTSLPATLDRPEAGVLAEQYVDRYVERERLAAGNAFLAEEVERLKAAGQPGSPADKLAGQFRRVDGKMGGALAGLLEENARPVIGDLDETGRQIGEQVEQARSTWIEVRTSLNLERLLLFEVKGSRRVAACLASLLSVDKAAFWVFGLVAVGTLLGVVIHERRHQIRRLFNGGRARAMGLSTLVTAALAVLVVLTLVTFLMGDRIYEALLSAEAGEELAPRKAIAAENQALQAGIEPLREARRKLREAHAGALDQMRTALAGSLPPTAALPAQASAFRARLLEIAEQLALLDRLAEATQADLAELGELNRELDTQAEATARYLRLRGWIRGGLGLALLGLALGGGWLYRRGLGQRRADTTNRCPLCLSSGRLKPVREAPQGGPPQPGMKLVRCTNVINQNPYQQCDYTFLDVYRGMSKLCFPTLGVPQAGKTHWLAMLYWELNRGAYPAWVQFEKVKSESADDFDLIVEEILKSRIGTAATQRERIPHPLVFSFQDHDRWGRSSVLGNIFDYSGEVTSDMSVDDYRRRRALEGDGFLFFLDPTYPSEPQAKALAAFREDLRLVKGIKAGRRVRVPVALCVSKIDLLARQSFALPDGGDAVEKFYEDLGRIDPTGEALTLSVIEARSRLLSELRETIWPGWEIQRQMDDLFGGRYSFFPLTPVGLDGRGETDLSLRTISPFGLLEPLLWLFEMNGYPVLK